jgi:hypothetical protein
MDYLFHYPFVKSGDKGPIKIDILPATFWTEKGRNAFKGRTERSTAFRAIRGFQPFYFTPAVYANKGNVGWFKRMLTYSTVSRQEKAYQSLS